MTSPDCDTAQLWMLYFQAFSRAFGNQLGHEQGGARRRGIYSLVVLVWMMMYQRLNGKRTLSSTVHWLARNATQLRPFNDCKRLQTANISTNTGGYCQARGKLDKLVAIDVMDHLFEQFQQRMREETPEMLRPVFVVDGTTLRTPYGKELAQQFPPGRNQHGENHWPTMLVVAFHDVHTGLAARPSWGPMYGDEAVSEQRLAAEALERLPADAVVLGDGNFGIFFFAYTVQQTQRPLLLRLTLARATKILGNSGLRPGRRRRAIWEPSAYERRMHPGLPEGCAVQGWVVACRNPSRPAEILYFFTSLDLKPRRILALYKLRWNIETDLRSLKRTVGLHELTGRRPDTVEKELLLAVSAYNLVRAAIYQAAQRTGLRPRDFSFSAAQDALMAAWNDLSAATTGRKHQQEVERLLQALEQTKLPKRVRQRSYPRKIWGRGGHFPSHRSSPSKGSKP
jgi:hypothetical protein